MARVSQLLFLSLSLSGCLIDDIDGNGERVEERRELERFSAVESSGSFDVRIAQGNAFEAVVSIDSNLIDHIATRVHGGRLLIEPDTAIGDAVSGPHVRVTVPELRSATLSGSGSVVVSAFEQDEAIALTLSGSGEVVFSGSVPELAANLSGSGDILLAGAAERVDLDLSGSGTIDAEELEAERGAIELAGSGEVRATILGAARVSLDGSGDIDLFGQPEVELSKSGSGDVHVRE
jgi:hypothetical protein